MSELTTVSRSDSEATVRAIQYYCAQNKLHQITANAMIDSSWYECDWRRRLSHVNNYD